MSVLGGLLDKIRGKRQERFTSTAEQYDDCVHKLASGQEVDLDHLAGLLDDLDKSDGDLESDVEAKQRRIEARSELDRLAEVSKQIPAKEAELLKLNDEITAYVAARKPKIQSLSEELKMLRLEVDRRGYLEHDLLNVGVPLALAQRRQALKLRQDDLFRKQEEYRNRTESAIRVVDAARVRLEDTKLRLSRATIPYDIEAIRGEAESLERRIAAYSDQIAAWAPLKAEIAAEQAAFHQESNEINRALMTP
jgi:hypothetical protein